ncbi:Phthalate 4,5-dioxygenase [Delftia sp. Cs1-4]|uniref:Rieske 2Fe-2S domain-containing protein n=1 Tax=Delftia sp. (strain Cs1-4) TaxID=742013 RepID=UPI00020E798C|nr:Rieske 2Fe-2S domain-containing protein [Delftia sp. Cs1-4]AEF88692.1 Phthalate 4,5-dioxygenase [Delftia sp. Cs1-4]
MLTKEENELMCQVEGDAPMGQIIRRHWIPACLSEEVAERDGKPVKVRLLGEDLVAFRDSDGKVGLIDEKCPHRRASLVYGRNEEGGLRCLYHGWKLDASGNVVDMPSEPAASELKHKVKHVAYPTLEWAGVVWTYMGPADEQPEFQPPPWAPKATTKVSIAKIIIPCNWAQILEGAIDSAHSSSLHSSDMVPARVDSAKATAVNWLRPSTDKAPRLQCQTTGYGFRYAALRRPISGADANDYVRLTVFVAPFTVLIPPNDSYNVANVNVPVDDTHTAFHFIGWSDTPENLPDTETWRKFLGAQVGVDLDPGFKMRRNTENFFWQDRQAMKSGNFTGIQGIPNQDIAMWVTMGALADRDKDVLGASDVAIVEFRRQMAKAAKEFQEGAPAIGTGSNRVTLGVRSFQQIVPKSTDWRSLGIN